MFQHLAYVLISTCIVSYTSGVLTTGLVRQDWPLVKLCSLSQLSLSLSSTSLSRASQRMCSMILPGTEVRLTVSSFQGPPFYLFKKWVQSFLFCSNQRLHLTAMKYHSNIMECGLEAPSANFLSTLGCISFVPIDLCVLRFLR